MKTIQTVLALLAALSLATGCGRRVTDQLEAVTAGQSALWQRLEALERENAALRDAVADAARQAPTPDAPVPLAGGGLSTNMVDALARTINDFVLRQVDAHIDARIAERVGTPDDIETIFMDIMRDELAAREERERRGREDRRRLQTQEWDQRAVERQTQAAALAPDKTARVQQARATMRERIETSLPTLKAQGATVEAMLDAVAESRRAYETELDAILSDEERTAYEQADWWSRRQDGRVNQIAEAVALDETQKQLVGTAYGEMRNRIGDGFTLMSQGYIDQADARAGMDLIRRSYTDDLRRIMTEEQFATYEATPEIDGRRGMGRFRGMQP